MIFKPLLRLPRWVLTGGCTALILYLTLVPKPLPDNDIPFWEHTDKIVHAIMFGSLYVCLFLDLWRGRNPGGQGAWWAVVPVVVLGGLIEILQQAMEMGRGGDIADFAADLAGTILALLLMKFITRRPC